MATAVHYQNVLVMRHGKPDPSDPVRIFTPWDFPMSSEDKNTAMEIGRTLRAQLEFRIHRIVLSPFRTCVWTALGLIWGLSPVDAEEGNSDNSSTSRIKLSLEYGMCEMMNDVALRHQPRDRKSWGIDIEALEGLFNFNMPEHVEIIQDRLFMELPQWGESESEAKDRYLLTIHSIVDKYPEENILFITHGEGVKAMASTYWEEARGREIVLNYFGYVHLKQQILRNGDSFAPNGFEIAGSPGETGIRLA